MWKVTCEGLSFTVPYSFVSEQIQQTAVANRKRISATSFELGSWLYTKIVV